MQKKPFLIAAALGVMLVTTASTCHEDYEIDPAPVVNDYTCKCTYVPMSGGPSSGEPNKEETNTVKAETLGEATTKCKQLESKYMGNYFTGTCLIQ
jgi:hypothetical protein